MTELIWKERRSGHLVGAQIGSDIRREWFLESGASGFVWRPESRQQRSTVQDILGTANFMGCLLDVTDAQGIGEAGLETAKELGGSDISSPSWDHRARTRSAGNTLDDVASRGSDINLTGKPVLAEPSCST